MKHLVLVGLLLGSACTKKADAPPPPPTTGSNTPVDMTKPTDTKPADTKPAATGAIDPKAVEAVPECKEFLAAMDKLIKCPALKDGAASMKEGNEKMLKAMIDLGDKKAMADGCKTGMSSLTDALKVAGC